MDSVIGVAGIALSFVLAFVGVIDIIRKRPNLVVLTPPEVGYLDMVEQFYFYIPIDPRGGNTSSFYIKLLVENDSDSPASLVAAKIKDNNHPEMWFTSYSALNKPDEIFVRIMNEGEGDVIKLQPIELPLRLEPHESKFIGLMFPVSGNNVNSLEDIDPLAQVPYEIELVTTKKSYKKSGLAFVGNRVFPRPPSANRDLPAE